MKSRSGVHPLMRLVIGGSMLVLAFGLIAFGSQKKRRPPAPKTNATVKTTPIDYAHFWHSTKKHQAECKTCHKIPTDNWKKVGNFPDITDFPSHDACVSCHRQQFFKGAKPAICSVCHSKVSPRDDVRLVFQSAWGKGEFEIEFPHDKHQDVIARLSSPPRKTGGLFQRASFTTATFTADDKTKHYNNCEICHGPRTTAPMQPMPRWVDAFVPDAASFRAVPTSHAACFSCHWKARQPINENCGGCHKRAARPPFKMDTVYRLSMKFRHAREQHIAECTTCHINITKASTLRGLQPDVPITSCTECHNKDGLRQDVSKELEALDKNREFVCSYCHTSDVGERDAPASHYLIAGRAALKRKDIK